VIGFKGAASVMFALAVSRRGTANV
jgi:hypothetical protein